MVKRLFDIIIVLIIAVLVLPVALCCYLLVKGTSKGPALYWSKRVGLNNKIFDMPKFRSMHINTPALATHVLNQQENPGQYLTPVGLFLRKSSLDEIPQLWPILKGDMSIVGPRPALFNQDNLISQRTQQNIHKIKPGLTGWAQVNGRDEVSIPKKVELDIFYLKNQSFSLDCYIILLTFIKVLKQDNISN